jgi:hypothetical protein
MTTNRTRITMLALSAAVLAATSGCGGSKGISRSELVAKADPICRRANSALISSKISQQNVVQVAPAVAAAQRQAYTELAKLAPPSAMAGDWQTIVNSWRTAGESLLKFSEATKTKDTQAELTAESGFTRAQQVRASAATRHGFHDCAQY